MQFKSLTPEEAAEFVKSTNARLAVDLTPYYDIINSVPERHLGVITLDEGDDRRTVKRRLFTAGKKMGKTVNYVGRTTKTGTTEIRFLVTDEAPNRRPRVRLPKAEPVAA